MDKYALARAAGLFSGETETVAIALSGSRTAAINDAWSDYDIYVYTNGHIDEKQRHKLFRSICDDYRIGSSLFEEGDELHIDGIPFDIMYRPVSWTRNEIEDVWLNHNARLGYTTCFISNFKGSTLLYDRNGEIGELFHLLDTPYPEELRDNIISKNLYIIEAEFDAPYIRQLELAIKRDDIISQNHRVAAILASYFDILFAFNRVLHPGEKKLEKYAYALCKAIPQDFGEDMWRVCTSSGENLLTAVKLLMEHLHQLIGK